MDDFRDGFLAAPAEAESPFGDFTSPSMDPVFWRPRLVGADSAWRTHIPFAHWLISACRPNSVVELGTYKGASYFAFCEAVLRLELECRCYAVDTWTGDRHTQLYDESVFSEV